jgi:hypothetical protein
MERLSISLHPLTTTGLMLVTIDGSTFHDKDIESVAFVKAEKGYDVTIKAKDKTFVFTGNETTKATAGCRFTGFAEKVPMPPPARTRAKEDILEYFRREEEGED